MCFGLPNRRGFREARAAMNRQALGFKLGYNARSGFSCGANYEDGLVGHSHLLW